MNGNGRRIATREALLVAAALLLYWVMAVSVSPRLGVTADEVVHLTGGYSYWKFNAYRLHPENGTLPMRVATLPLLAMELTFPPLDDPHWLSSKVNLVGEKFFFQHGNPVDRMLLASRAMIALVGVLTCWLTWRWARDLFGRAAGAIALVLAVFCPALLAHGGLATSDMALTACLLGALSLMWRLYHRVTWPRLAGASLVCGLTFLAKMSGVFLVPLLGGMLLVRWWRGVPLVLAFGREHWVRGRARVAVATSAATLLVAAGSIVVLWGGYGFRYEGFNRGVSDAEDYYLSWDVILDRAPLPRPTETSLGVLQQAARPTRETTMTRLIGTLRDFRVLPEAYLWGFAHTYKFSRYRPAYFLGDYRETGWRMYFPIAFLLKTPLPALALIGAGGGALIWMRRRPEAHGWLYRVTPWALFFVFYWVMSINMSLNIGHRHIVPTYPVFYVLAGAATLWLVPGFAWRRLAIVAIAALGTWHVVESLRGRPFYLSYFHQLAGGQKGGYRYLVDSSFDWGQGLPDLEKWIATRRAAGDASPIFLTYFGADSPRARGLDVVRFGDETNDTGERVFPAPVRGGWFVIGATHFHRVYFPTRGREWTATHESLYRSLLERRAAATHQSEHTAEQQAQLLQDLMDLELMQFSRLTHFLKHREPLEIIGGSLLVFRLSDEEVARALYGPAP